MVSRLEVTVVTIVLHFVARRGRTRATISRRRIFLRADLPENRMSKIEYKTILLPYKTGLFQDLTRPI